ncbi:MAG: NAD(P)/FAD-dependent oxidoreductase [Blautia wexlerae]
MQERVSSDCAICDGSFYRGKSVAVLGGGDTALDDAVYLADVAEKVYVIHRRKEFRGAAVTVAKLREKENVIFVLEHQVKEIIGEQKVTGVVLEDAAVIDVNGVFVAYGAVPQTDLLKKFAVLDDSGYVRAGETGETALEGLQVWQEMQEQRNCVSGVTASLGWCQSQQPQWQNI